MGQVLEKSQLETKHFKLLGNVPCFVAMATVHQIPNSRCSDCSPCSDFFLNLSVRTVRCSCCLPEIRCSTCSLFGLIAQNELFGLFPVRTKRAVRSCSLFGLFKLLFGYCSVFGGPWCHWILLLASVLTFNRCFLENFMKFCFARFVRISILLIKFKWSKSFKGPENWQIFSNSLKSLYSQYNFKEIFTLCSSKYFSCYLIFLNVEKRTCWTIVRK